MWPAGRSISGGHRDRQDYRGTTATAQRLLTAADTFHSTQSPETNLMAQREYSRYQQKVIQRYYDNREQIDEQRLSELVTNLYLSEGKKREKLWVTARDLMLRLGVPESRVEHVVASNDAAILAEVMSDIQAGKIQPKKDAGRKQPPKSKS